MTVIDDVRSWDEVDVPLVREARTGDLPAFASLYARHQARILRQCRGVLGNDDDAADAAQETFLRAWRALDHVDDGRRFGSWLRTIATNVCIDMLRRRKRTVVVEDFESTPSEVADGEAIADARAQAESLSEALGRLSHRHQEVLWLRECEGWTYERIAAHQDLDLSAVKSLLWRARQALRREFLSLTSPGVRLGILGGLFPMRFLHRMWSGLGTAGGGVVAAAAVSSAVVLPALVPEADGPVEMSLPAAVVPVEERWSPMPSPTTTIVQVFIRTASPTTVVVAMPEATESGAGTIVTTPMAEPTSTSDPSAFTTEAFVEPAMAAEPMATDAPPSTTTTTSTAPTTTTTTTVPGAEEHGAGGAAAREDHAAEPSTPAESRRPEEPPGEEHGPPSRESRPGPPTRPPSRS